MVLTLEIAEYRRADSHRLLSVLGALMILATTMPLTGCVGVAGFRLRSPRDQFAGMPRTNFSTDPQMEEVVDHLNRNVQKLHAWQAHNVKIRANNMPLSGTLAVEEGQRLRLVVHSIVGHEVDMGSNDELFWIWAKRMEPSYVYCRHEEIDGARQALGIPFEPHWLMQALGVAPLETTDLTMQIDASGRRARLVQPVVTAHGHPLQKVMQVDLVHGVITEHSIYDARGMKIAQAQLEDFRKDKKSGAILARRVKLDWPQTKMSLVMNLGNVEINPASIPSQIWDMPQMPGVQMVDLGKESHRDIRVAEAPAEPAGSWHDNEDPASSDDAGRIQLSLDGSEGDSTDTGEPEIPISRPVNTASRPMNAASQPVDTVRHQSAPIERPAKKDWWDE